MQSSADILKNKSIADLVKAARGSSSNVDETTLRKTKDIGGILIPGAWQTPNEIIDDGWMRELSGGEFKVLMYLIRKTFGFNKISGDKVPLSQIMNGTGLTKPTALAAIKTLEKCSLIRVKRSRTEDGTRNINFYSLIVRDNYSNPK